MSFIEDNKYYIIQVLSRGMKGLSDDDRRKSYKELRIEVRKRLTDSYANETDKSRFYQEAFKILSFYEADYLFLNLFYEKSSVGIINDLFKEKLLENLSFLESNSLPHKYYLYLLSKIKKGVEFNHNDEVNFFKTNILQLIEGITTSDWDEKNRSENMYPFISKYSKWIAHNIDDEINHEKVIQSFIIFVRMWNSFDNYSKPFNNAKAILFYTNISAAFNKDIGHTALVNFYKFIYKLGCIFSYLFVELEYIPLLDKKDSTSYKPGYLIKRNELIERFKQSEKSFSFLKVDSLLSLFQSTNDSRDELIIERIQSILKIKIDNYELPKYAELCEISNYKLTNNSKKARDYLFEKLYLFEFI